MGTRDFHPTLKLGTNVDTLRSNSKAGPNQETFDRRNEMMKLADGRGVEYLTVRQGNTILKFK
jgi:hypothetical protein